MCFGWCVTEINYKMHGATIKTNLRVALSRVKLHTEELFAIYSLFKYEEKPEPYLKIQFVPHSKHIRPQL